MFFLSLARNEFCLKVAEPSGVIRGITSTAGNTAGRSYSKKSILSYFLAASERPLKFSRTVPKISRHK